MFDESICYRRQAERDKIHLWMVSCGFPHPRISDTSGACSTGVNDWTVGTRETELPIDPGGANVDTA